MHNVKRQGWSIHLIYIGIETPKTHIQRVRERVKRGGHNVPIEDILRRYKRGLNNLPKAIKIADNVIIFDNSDRQYSLVATIEAGVLSMHIDHCPQWFSSAQSLFM